MKNHLLFRKNADSTATCLSHCQATWNMTQKLPLWRFVQLSSFSRQRRHKQIKFIAGKVVAASITPPVIPGQITISSCPYNSVYCGEIFVNIIRMEESVRYTFYYLVIAVCFHAWKTQNIWGSSCGCAIHQADLVFWAPETYLLFL